MAGAFFRHRGLIAFSAGGAMAETILLSFFAPSARARFGWFSLAGASAPTRYIVQPGVAGGYARRR